MVAVQMLQGLLSAFVIRENKFFGFQRAWLKLETKKKKEFIFSDGQPAAHPVETWMSPHVAGSSWAARPSGAPAADGMRAT